MIYVKYIRNKKYIEDKQWCFKRKICTNHVYFMLRKNLGYWPGPELYFCHLVTYLVHILWKLSTQKTMYFDFKALYSTKDTILGVRSGYCILI